MNRVLLALLAIFALVSADASAQEAEEGLPSTVEETASEAAERLGFEVARNAPLEISSAELEVKPDRGGRRRVVFKGNVKAVQADMHMSCQWLEAAYPKKGSGQPDRVTARGGVRIEQATNTALCQEAVFDNVACTATCKGASTRAVLQRGDDVIEADEIFFDLCEGLVHARGGATVRVKGEPAAE